jgi:hypothetical protein
LMSAAVYGRTSLIQVRISGQSLDEGAPAVQVLNRTVPPVRLTVLPNENADWHPLPRAASSVPSVLWPEPSEQ